MKLWLLQLRYPDSHGFDTAYGWVVRAVSEDAARQLVSEQRYPDKTPGDEGHGAWLDPTSTTCVELAADGEPGVILQDFLAG